MLCCRSQEEFRDAKTAVRRKSRTAVFAEWRYAFYDEGEEKRSMNMGIMDLLFQMQRTFHRGIYGKYGRQTRDPQPGEQEYKGTPRDQEHHQKPISALHCRRKKGLRQKAKEHPYTVGKLLKSRTFKQRILHPEIAAQRHEPVHTFL